MNYCADCKYKAVQLLSSGRWLRDFAILCQRPVDTAKINPVTGKPVTVFQYPEDERAAFRISDLWRRKRCGPEGRFFEPVPFDRGREP